jgi:CheY-like chemotaxis protein
VSADRRARIVVADDHPGVRDAVTATLCDAFEVVAVVSDGAAAIDATMRLRPDVVVLDVAMPGLDGFQTASRLATSAPTARVVFLSNYAADDFVLAGISRGASAFVPKAHLTRALVPAVQHTLAGRTFVPSATVLPRWNRRSTCRHDLQLYTTDAFLIQTVMAFFDSALEQGHSLLAVGSPRHLEALDAEFKARDMDLAALTASGRYARSDAGSALEAVTKDGVPDRARFEGLLDPLLERALAAATSSPSHVSMFGEIAPILCAGRDVEGMLRLERIAGDYTSAHPLSILCAYPTASLPASAGDLAARLCAEHSTIVPAESAL